MSDTWKSQVLLCLLKAVLWRGVINVWAFFNFEGDWSDAFLTVCASYLGKFVSFYFETHERKSGICTGSHLALVIQRVGYIALHWCCASCPDPVISIHATAAVEVSYLPPRSSNAQRGPTDEASPRSSYPARRMESPAQWQRIRGCLCRIPTTGRMDNPTTTLPYHLLFRVIRAPLSAWCGRRAERERGFSSDWEENGVELVRKTILIYLLHMH